MRTDRVVAGVAVLALGAALIVAQQSSATAADGLGLPFTGFGANGVARTAFDTLGNPSNDSGRAVAVQSDGKVVVAGRASRTDNSFSTMVVLRYLANGALDPTFGVGGKQSVGFQQGAHSSAAAVKVDGSGRIVIAGTVSNSVNLDDVDSKFALARLTPLGAIDPTFGANGRVVTSVGAGGGQGRGLYVLENGKPIVVGYGRSALNADPKGKVIRYTAAGGVDGSFAAGGLTLNGLQGRDAVVANAVDGQFSGHLIIGGSVTIGGSRYGLSARITADGVLDPNYGTGGYVELNYVGESDQVVAVRVLDQGAYFQSPRILFGGNYVSNATLFSFVFRGLNSGSSDPAFGAAGTAHLGVSGMSLTGMATRSDGSVLAVGTHSNDQTLVWVRNSGSVDARYGIGGVSASTVPGTAAALGAEFGPGGIAYVSGSNDVVNDDILVTAWNGNPVPPPATPVIRSVAKRGNNVTVSFLPGAGGGALSGFTYQFARLNPQGVARPIAQGGVIQPNGRSVVIPVNPQLPNLRVYITAWGLYGSSPTAVTLWNLRVAGPVRGCARVLPHTVRFDGPRAVVLFPARPSGCAQWRLGAGRFLALPRGRTQVATPPLAVGRGVGLAFRSNRAVTAIAVRRG